MVLLTPGQRFVVKQILTSVIIAIAALVIGSRVLPTPELPNLTAKLVYTLRWQMLQLLSLLAVMIHIKKVRFTTHQIDPLAKRDTELLDIHHRYTNNTMEQLMLSLPGQWILASYVDTYGMKLIPVFVLLFVCGRIAFWIGYSKTNSLRRGYGMAMTYCPTIGIYCYLVYCFIVYGSTYNLD